MSKKVNPRNRPATEADVDRARVEATSFTFTLVETVFLTTLLDKYNGSEHIIDVWKDASKLLDEILEGRVSLGNLIRVLRDEYGIELERDYNKTQGYLKKRG